MGRIRSSEIWSPALVARFTVQRFNGGKYGKGTVFLLTPPATQGAAWTENALFSFVYRSGESLDGGPASDKAGNLCGTTSYGGNATKGLGTVFQLAPPAESGSPWKFTGLHTFHEPQRDRPDGGGDH
jgi:hypothetical protein